jgi:hypothetical protein
MWESRATDSTHGCSLVDLTLGSSMETSVDITNHSPNPDHTPTPKPHPHPHACQRTMRFSYLYAGEMDTGNLCSRSTCAANGPEILPPTNHRIRSSLREEMLRAAERRQKIGKEKEKEALTSTTTTRN